MTETASPERLGASLDTLVRLCGDLEDVLARERSALAAAQDHELVRVLQEKRERLKALADAESERRAVAAELARSLGLPEDAPLSRLAQRVGADTAARWVDHKDRLLNVMRDVGALNQANARLIRRAQYYSRHLWGLVSASEGRTYGPTGESPATPPAILRKDA